MRDRGRDTLIVIQRSIATLDSYGGEVLSWSEYARAWAKVHYGRGDERRQAAQEQRVQAATFVVPANSLIRALTITDRIVLAGFIWDINGIVPGAREYEITAAFSGDAVTPGEPGQFDFSDPVNSGLLALLLEDA